MKTKKLISGLLAAIMLVSLMGNFAFAATSEPDVSYGYHYIQLSHLGRIIYDGIDSMNLMTGTDEYDLVGNGLNSASLPSNTELNQAMNAARYAYYADHPQVFYVDFPKLTLRSTQGADGGKHV